MIENLVTQWDQRIAFAEIFDTIENRLIFYYLAFIIILTVEKKESYKNNLPHFQQSGQAYFVTWILKDAVPPKAFLSYTEKLKHLKAQIEFQKQNNAEKLLIDELKIEYGTIRKKYIKAYDDLLALSENNIVDLSKSENLKVIANAMHFWENSKLINYAYSIMPNHVHWVLELFKEDKKGAPVYLQDILQSVKRHTANRINKLEGRTGSLWQKESFDTTIRNEEHLYNAVEYTLINPVKAGFVSNWKEWKGNFLSDIF